MIKYKKFINISFKMIGALYLIQVVLYLFNIYEPYKWGIAGNMLLIGLFCLLVDYTEKNTERKK